MTRSATIDNGMSNFLERDRQTDESMVMSNHIYDGGQTNTVPTEADVTEAFHDAHPNCLDCDEVGCIDLGCMDCLLDKAQEAEGVGYVHDSCRDHYTVISVRNAVAAALLVRNGSEISTGVATERANNIAMILCEQFDVRLK